MTIDFPPLAPGARIHIMNNSLRGSTWDFARTNRFCANKPRHAREAGAIGLTVVTDRALFHDSIYTPGNQLCILVFKFIIQK